MIIASYEPQNGEQEDSTHDGPLDSCGILYCTTNEHACFDVSESRKEHLPMNATNNRHDSRRPRKSVSSQQRSPYLYNLKVPNKRFDEAELPSCRKSTLIKLRQRWRYVEVTEKSRQALSPERNCT